MISLDTYQPNFNKIIEQLREELSRLRTGRANPSILDGVNVESYGAMMPLKGVASINTADAKTITVEPWDKNLLKEIEKAILAANIGLNPVNDGKILRLVLPPMTEEFRRSLVKVIGQKLEQERISLRQLRDQIRESIAEEEKNKEIGEDQRFQMQDRLEKMVKDVNDTLKKMAEEKEEEVMTI